MKASGKILRAGVFFGILTAFSAPGFSAIIFDNANPPLSNTTRFAPGLGAAAYLQIGASDVQITQIAINAAPTQSGQLKFVIFSDIASPGSTAGSLLLSDSVNVTANATLSYILSDPISFTLQAGHYYDIGAIFSGDSITYSFDVIPNTQNGISSLLGNANVQSFTSPTLINHNTADINIQLFGPAATTVPEPGSLTLFGIALALTAGRRFLRKQL